MKKLIALQLLLLATVEAHGAEFGSLNAGTYRVLVNGIQRETVQSADGVVSLTLPGGSLFIGLRSESEEPQLPTEDTESPAFEDHDQEVFLASFDETTQTNRFTLLDRQGLQVVGPVAVLEGANTEGKVMSTDLDGDGLLEVLAAGYVPDEGVVLEYWTGDGNQIVRVNVFDVTFDAENHLVSIDLDGEPGHEAMLIGRDTTGAYQVKTYDAMGAPLNHFVAFAGEYDRIDSILAANVRGEGREEAVVLARTPRDTMEMKVLDGGTVVSSAPLFGSGFVGRAALFPIDLDGDGDSEIGAARKSARSDSHRLTVSDWNGDLLLKASVLSGKYDEEVVFCAADVDGDGREEVAAVGRLEETGANILEILDDNGDLLGSREVLAPSFNGTLTALCAELNGGLEEEIVVGGKDSYTGLVAYQVVGPTCEILSGGSFFAAGVDFQAALFPSDIDMDGDQDLLAVGEYADGRYGLEMRDGSSGMLRFTADLWETPMELAEGELLK